MDYAAVGQFMWHEGVWIPHTLVFSSVYDPSDSHVHRVDPASLTSFSFADVRNNLRLPYDVFQQKIDDDGIPARDFGAHVRKHYYDSLNENRWEDAIVGTVDVMTYMYLQPLLPEVRFLGPALLADWWDLEQQRDVVAVATAAAQKLHRDRQASDDPYWTDV